jgi:cell division protease FtsH
MNQTVKAVIFWLVILLAATSLWQVVKNSNTQRTAEISYSQFLSELDRGTVTRVNISNIQADGTYRDGGRFRVNLPTSQEQMLQSLQQTNVEVWYVGSSSGSATWLINLLAPLALVATLWFFMIRQMRTKVNLDRARASFSDISSQGPNAPPL